MQQAGEARGVLDRHDRVPDARDYEHGLTASLLFDPTFEGHHRSQQNAAGQHFGAQQQNCRCNVGAIGVTQGDRRGDGVAVADGGHKIRQLVCAPLNVLHIEDPLGDAAEEARHAVLEDVAPR